MSVPPSSIDTTPLVGRDHEVSHLRQHLATAIGGRGSLVLVGGDAGIGKTTLVEALCAHARSLDCLIISGHGFDLAGTPPYGLWIDLFARLPDEVDRPPLPPAFAERGTVGAVPGQLTLFVQMLDFLAVLARRRPLVLVLEDLHWCDLASLELLYFLSRSVPTLPLLIVATYRTEDLGRTNPLYRALPRLRSGVAVEELTLGPLDDRAIHALVASRFALTPVATRDLVTSLQARAEGNALFITELLRSLVEMGTLRRDGDAWALGPLQRMDVPAPLRQVIDARVSRLEDEDQRLLAVVAVLGHEVSVTACAAVGAVGEERALALVERGLDARLLVEAPDDGRVRFSHALIREAVYQAIPRAHRQQLHLRAAAELLAQPDPDPDAVAHHLGQAGDRRAVEWLIRAGERSQRAFAWLAAAERFEAALALMPPQSALPAERGWLLFRLARLRRFAASAEALRHAEEALASAGEDRVLAACARYAHGQLISYNGQTEAGMRELARAADAIEGLSPAELAHAAARTGCPADAWRAARGTWMAQAAVLGHYADVLALADRWAQMPEPDRLPGQDVPPYGDGWYGLTIALGMTGRAQEAEAASARALRSYRAIEPHILLGTTTLVTLVHVALPYHADRVAERTRIAAASATAYRKIGVVWPIAPELAYAWVDVLDGRWQAASIAGLTAAFAIRHNPMGPALLAGLACARGETEQAWELVRLMLPDGLRTEPGHVDLREALGLQEVATVLSLDRGDLTGAAAWADMHDRWLAWSGAVLGRSEGQALWARYHRACGDAPLAQRHAERALADAGDPRQPLALLAAHRLLGELAAESGRDGDARTHLEAALALADACKAPYERSLTLLALAELRTATGDAADARSLLDEVRTVCAPLGARPALARAEALATRIEATQSAMPSYPAGLSAREVEVLRLVAQGLTNPQVAERLFLSPRTVEQHLRSVYNKLGISTRAAAAAFAVSHDLA